MQAIFQNLSRDFHTSKREPTAGSAPLTSNNNPRCFRRKQSRQLTSSKHHKPSALHIPSWEEEEEGSSAGRRGTRVEEVSVSSRKMAREGESEGAIANSMLRKVSKFICIYPARIDCAFSSFIISCHFLQIKYGGFCKVVARFY